MYILPVEKIKLKWRIFKSVAGEHCEKQLWSTVENFNSIYTMGEEL